MTLNSIRTNFDEKSGVTVKVTLSFVAICLVSMVLASYLFGPRPEPAAPGSKEIASLADDEAVTPPVPEAVSPDAQQTATAGADEAVTPPIEEAVTRNTGETASLPGNEPPALHVKTPEPATPAVEAFGDIPNILSAKDADLYRRIFSLQKQRKIKKAKKLAARLENKLLMGHVLAQRLQRQSRPPSKQLRKWLRKYSDHPDYGRIKRLVQAQKKRRSRKSRPPLIRRNRLNATPAKAASYATKKNLTRKQRRRVSRIKRTARIWLRRGQITRTEKLLRRGYVVRLLDRYEMDEARGMIAAAWFYHGRDRKAYKLAKKVIARSGKVLPMTHWIAGLAAWRMGKTKQALNHFETLAATPEMSGWIGAGAALWAARAHEKLENKAEARHWLESAAGHPYTLYGVLALNALGRDLPFEERQHPLTATKLALLTATKGGKRALALSETGQMLRAEQELLALKEWRKPGMKEALRAIADHLQLPSIAIRLTRHQVKDDDDGRAGEPLDPALYPIPPWNPAAKSGIDRALLFAIMRQESDFNSFAHSPVGALGLMQIMPNTARMLNRGRRPFRGSRRLDKYDPKIIVKFGQRYLTHLRKHKRVKNDLLRVIAAYNSGPGNIGYWARKRIKHDQDPLLFIEAIPNLETRLFVRRVLANLWIYRRRLDQRVPSLEAMSAGQFPRYRPIDGKDGRRAKAEFPRHTDG